MNMINSTTESTNIHLEQKVDLFFQALGKSIGGLITKIHILTDGNGLPLKIHLTEVKTHDSVLAKNLLKNLITDSLIGDKAYDSFDIIDFIQNQGVKSVIPSRKTNLVQRNYDKDKYKERNLIERFFNKIRHFRRISTRYEKLARNYKSMILIGFVMLWIRFKNLI